MNRKQRESNRKNARGLSLQAMITGIDDQEGFWTCDKFYGEDGRRIL